MTPKERRVLDYIEAFLTENRIAPSMQEIADHMGLASKAGAHRMVKSLLRAGKLVRTQSATRNIVPAKGSLAEFPTTALRAELQRRELGHG